MPDDTCRRVRLLLATGLLLLLPLFGFLLSVPHHLVSLIVVGAASSSNDYRYVTSSDRVLWRAQQRLAPRVDMAQFDGTGASTRHKAN